MSFAVPRKIIQPFSSEMVCFSTFFNDTDCAVEFQNIKNHLKL